MNYQFLYHEFRDVNLYRITDLNNRHIRFLFIRGSLTGVVLSNREVVGVLSIDHNPRQPVNKILLVFPRMGTRVIDNHSLYRDNVLFASTDLILIDGNTYKSD